MTSTWLGFGILGLILSAPLLYAFSTLLNMRHKTMYPLLRAHGTETQRPLIWEVRNHTQPIERRR
jgi:hypothetical protein